MSVRTPILTGRDGARELRFELPDGRHAVGRAAESDLVLTHPSVSRRHAVLECRDGAVVLEDLGSHNGTRVNGAPVSGRTPLARGDEIRFADVVLRLGEPGDTKHMLTLAPEQASRGMAVSWDELDPAKRPGDRKRSELFRCLAGAGDLLTVPRPPEELFEPILDLVEQAMDPERIFLLLREEGAPAPEIRASRLRRADGEVNVALSRSVVNRVLEERTSFLLEDGGGEGDLLNMQSIVSAGIRSAMAAPLFDNKSVIGILYADTTDPARSYVRDELVAFSLLANVIAVALSHARHDAIEAEKRRLDAELDAARSIMTQLLPDTLPTVPGYAMHAHLEPCFEVGGDLYDVTLLPDGRCLLAAGDVSGKGLGAALLVSSLLPLLRAMLEAESDLTRVAANLNRQLWRTTDALRYATLFVGVLEPESGRLAYVNAGHSPPLVVRADGSCEAVPPNGLPIALLEEGAWTSGELSLAPGDLLALSSDGIAETFAADGDDYTDERFQARVAAGRALAPADIARDVLDDVEAFRGAEPVGDDVTLVLVKRLG